VGNSKQGGNKVKIVKCTILEGGDLSFNTEVVTSGEDNKVHLVFYLPESLIGKKHQLDFRTPLTKSVRTKILGEIEDEDDTLIRYELRDDLCKQNGFYFVTYANKVTSSKYVLRFRLSGNEGLRRFGQVQRIKIEEVDFESLEVVELLDDLHVVYMEPEKAIFHFRDSKGKELIFDSPSELIYTEGIDCGLFEEESEV
jgi:hypothetical protein